MSAPRTPRRLACSLLLALVVTGCSSGGHLGDGSSWQPSPAVEHDLIARSPRPPATAQQATIVRVVDGDTVIGQLPGQPSVRVRIIGVDTPETVKPDTPVACFGPQASAYAKHLLTGLTVTIAYEPGGRLDHYGRDLWDIWLPDGRLLAAMLVADGLGRAYPFPPQVSYAPLLQTLQAEARAAGRGLWGPPCHGNSFSTPNHTWPPP